MDNAVTTPALFEPATWKAESQSKSQSLAGKWDQAFAGLFKGHLAKVSLFTDQGNDKLMRAHHQRRANVMAQERQQSGYAHARSATPLDRLRRSMDQSGLGRSKVVVGAEDRPLVERVLTRSGFDKDTANKIIDQSTGPDGSINLNKVLTVADKLRQAGRDDPSVTMSASNKPLLLQVLTQLGLSPDELKEAMAKLSEKDGQADLRALLDWLEAKAQGKSKVDLGALTDLLSALGLGGNDIARLLAEGVGAEGRLDGKGLADLLRQAGLLQANKKGDGDAILAELAKNMKLKSEAGADKTLDNKVLAALRHRLSMGDGKQLKLPFGIEDADLDNGQLTGRHLENLVQGGLKSPEAAKGQARAGADTAAKANPAPNAGQGAQRMEAQGISAAEGATKAASPKAGPSVQAAHIVRQVADYMGPMVLRGKHQLSIQLEPPHLGKIALDVVLKEGTLQATILTESHVVKHAIEANLNDLKQQLAEQGVNVDRFDVEVRQDSPGGTSSEDENQTARGGAGGEMGVAGTEADDLEAERLAARLRWNGGRHVNLFA